MRWCAESCKAGDVAVNGELAAGLTTVAAGYGGGVGLVFSQSSSGGGTPTNAGGQAPNANPYSNLTDSPSVGPGKNFTQTQKANIYQENMANNGGVLRFRPERRRVGHAEQERQGCDAADKRGSD